MSICTMSELTSATPMGPGAPATRVTGATALAALGLLCGALVSQPAEAALKPYGDRHQILERLEQAHAETPQALGLSVDSGVIRPAVQVQARFHPLPRFTELHATSLGPARDGM